MRGEQDQIYQRKTKKTARRKPRDHLWNDLESDMK